MGVSAVGLRISEDLQWELHNACRRGLASPAPMDPSGLASPAQGREETRADRTAKDRLTRLHLELEQKIAFLDMLVRLNGHFCDAARLPALDRDLHLHGLEDEDRLAAKHLVTGRTKDFFYGSGHGCGNINQGHV